MRSSAALAALATLALAAAPARADDPVSAGGTEPPAPAAPPPAAPALPAYSLIPPPYGVPPGAPAPYGPWMRPPVLVEGRANNAMRNAGIVFFAVGVTATLVGVVFLAGSLIDTQQCEDVPVPVEDRASTTHRGLRGGLGVAREALTLCDVGPAPGAISVAIGATLGIIGVPLFLVGNKPVLVPAPAVRLGVGTATLRWTF
jgi:hypothetical protein